MEKLDGILLAVGMRREDLLTALEDDIVTYCLAHPHLLARINGASPPPSRQPNQATRKQPTLTAEKQSQLVQAYGELGQVVNYFDIITYGDLEAGDRFVPYRNKSVEVYYKKQDGTASNVGIYSNNTRLNDIKLKSFNNNDKVIICFYKE